MKLFQHAVCLAGVLISLLVFSCCEDDDKCGEPLKANLRYEGDMFPFLTDQLIKFRHNHSDTQIFKVTNKEYFYVRQPGGPKCDVDHQSIKLSLLGMNTSENLYMEYVYDPQTFTQAFPDQATFLKLKFRNRWYTTQQYFSDADSVQVGDRKYNGVRFIGYDTITDYYIFRPQVGILRIKVPGEIWELITQ